MDLVATKDALTVEVRLWRLLTVLKLNMRKSPLIELLACDIAAYKAFVEKFQCYVMVIMTFVNKFGEASALQVLQGALNVKFSSTFFSEAWIRQQCHC